MYMHESHDHALLYERRDAFLVKMAFYTPVTPNDPMSTIDSIT